MALALGIAGLIVAAVILADLAYAAHGTETAYVGLLRSAPDVDYLQRDREHRPADEPAYGPTVCQTDGERWPCMVVALRHEEARYVR